MTSNDVFLGGGSNSGSIMGPELPNIKGNIKGQYSLFTDYDIWNTGGINGSFNVIEHKTVWGPRYDGYWDGVIHLEFDASRSNSLYNGSKLIPKHYVIEFWIKFK